MQNAMRLTQLKTAFKGNLNLKKKILAHLNYKKIYDEPDESVTSFGLR